MKGTRRLISAAMLAAIAICANAQETAKGAHQWESEIKKFEEADRQSPPPTGAVLFVGSSSIRLWRTIEKDFPDTKVINRGFGGSQIEDSTYFADRIIVPYKPRLVVLYAGDNDLAIGKTRDQVFEDYKAFVAKLRDRLGDVRIAFISIKPSLARWSLADKMVSVNEMIRRYSSKDKRLIFIDVYSAMLGADGKPRPELFVEDGLHMTPAGYALWRSIVAKNLKGL